MTATPVTLTRGPAVKIVDGPRTETVAARGLAGAARRAARRRAQRAPARARRRRARTPDEEGPLARLARASRRRTAAVERRSTTARRSIRCRPATRSSARRRSRATRSGRCSTTSSCCGRCRSGSASAIRVVDAGCGKAYMSLALVAYGREVGTRVELVGLDTQPGGDRDGARRSPTALGYDEARFEATTIDDVRERRADRPARLAARLRHRDRRGDRRRRAARRRGDRRRAVLPPRARRRRSRGTRRTACSGTGCCSAARPTSSPTRCAPPRSRSLGYRVDVIEFVSAEHTAKNVMLRAERAPSASARGACARPSTSSCATASASSPAIERLLPLPVSPRRLSSVVSVTRKGGTQHMGILWIILIVVLVLALLGFFSRGVW